MNVSGQLLTSQQIREQIRFAAIQPCMKRDGRKVSRSAQQEMRLIAFERMNEGETHAAVAASLGMHRGWAYKVRALTDAQQQQVFTWVNGKNPRQHGFDFGLWTRQIVRELVEQKFAVRSSLACIGALLARVGADCPKNRCSGPINAIRRR
jgi:transposase